MKVWNRLTEYIQRVWYKTHRFFTYVGFYLNKDFYSWYIHPTESLCFPASCRSFFTQPVCWKYDPIHHRLTHLLSSSSDHHTYRPSLLSATLEIPREVPSEAGKKPHTTTQVLDMDLFLSRLTIRTSPSCPPTLRALTLAWSIDSSFSLRPSASVRFRWVDEEAEEHVLPVFGAEDPFLPMKRVHSSH